VAAGVPPLVDYTVKHATRRIVLGQCRKSPGWLPGVGVRPRGWGDGGAAGAAAAAVPEMATRQERRWEEAFAAGPRRRINITSADQASLYYASWFDPSPPRLHVRQRVADRNARVSDQRAAQLAAAAAILWPLVDDRQDPVGGAEGATPPWVAAWRRAHHKRLPNEHRAFAWTLLHGGLRCGGSLIPLLGHGQLADALCPHPACAASNPRAVATLHHIFLECTAGRSALQWLCQLWGRIDPGQPPPPLSPSVLLADCWDTWAPRPGSGLQGLWVVLRVCMLRCIWFAYIKARDGQQAALASEAILSRFVAEVRSLIQQEWLRVQGDVGRLCGVCPAWLRGRALALSEAQFISRWCAQGVLAQVVPAAPGAAATLRLCLTRQSA